MYPEMWRVLHWLPPLVDTPLPLWSPPTVHYADTNKFVSHLVLAQTELCYGWSYFIGVVSFVTNKLVLSFCKQLLQHEKRQGFPGGVSRGVPLVGEGRGEMVTARIEPCIKLILNLNVNNLNPGRLGDFEFGWLSYNLADFGISAYHYYH